MMFTACCKITEIKEEDESVEPCISLRDNGSMPSILNPEITIHALPDEILAKVFLFLPLEDLARGIPRVCRRWACVSEDSEVWRNKIYAPPALTPYMSIENFLRCIPKLEGIFLSKFTPSETVKYVCKSLNLYSPNIKHLSMPVNVSKCYPIMNVLCQKCEFLVSLNLRFCNFYFLDNHSVDILRCVGQCQNLKSLTLSGVLSGNAIDLEAIAVGCSKLQTLNIKDCEMYAPNSLECLLRREADTLTSLALAWNFQGNQRTLPVVAKYCQKLEKLCVVEPEKMFGFKVTCQDVAALRQMTHLKELSMPSVKDDVLKDFIELFENGLFKNLEKLDFAYNQWVKNILVVCIISNCPNLRILLLEYCYELTSDAFQSISDLEHLKLLNLEGCVGLRDEAVSHIVKCRRLRYLNVNRVFALTRLSLIQCCESLKYLQELHITVYSVYHEDLKNVPCHLRLILNCMSTPNNKLWCTFDA